MLANDVLLECDDLSVRYVTAAGVIRAVERVSLSVNAGQTVALVGESGCGKSTLARALIGLEPMFCGNVRVAGRELGAHTDRFWLSRQMQMVFQDPDASLNPRLTVASTLLEPLKLHHALSRSELYRRSVELLEQVGMEKSFLQRYPHELSGGQKQRVCVARALSVSPKLLICDEAVSSLDVSIQAQLLNLLSRLQAELGMAYLFITHDLSVVRHLADEVCVMYLGQIVERGPVETVFEAPLHPYTQGLLQSVPIPDPTRPRLKAAVMGDVPSPLNPPSGCRFHTRCALSFDRCRQEAPALYRQGEHGARCFLVTPDRASDS